MDSSPSSVQIVSKVKGTEEPKGTRFQVGEMLPWKGVWFRVKEVKEHELVLQAVSSVEPKKK